ncbi:NHL repeat-containing protein [Geopsychrobacter electrodiphilus]|uniref:NHL repeat-containing protein n=1 Tax=Geopsychrobacter electrodiphilus TaxID=225196 RepID=UPI000363E567|nr:NHL repeat-containing protein [Geopsychrobacter electrodiphilus]
MRNILIIITAFCLWFPLTGLATETVKLKHIKSIYSDSAGVGLKYPEGVACNNTSFVVADTGNRQLVRFKLQDQTFSPESSMTLTDSSPRTVQLTALGDIYVLDAKARNILKLNAAGESQGKLAIKGLADADKIVPKSFKLDSAGNIYLLDIFANRVIVAGPDQTFIRQINFPARFGFFSDLAVNNQGSIYLLDSVDADIFVAEPGADAFVQLTKGLKEYVNFPANIAVDGHGIIFLSDQNGSGLVLIGRAGSFLGRKLGSGWDEGQLQYPAQICINDQYQLFVADRNNNRVQVFSILAE